MVPVGFGLGDRDFDAPGCCQEVVRWQKNVSLSPGYRSKPFTNLSQDAPAHLVKSINRQEAPSMLKGLVGLGERMLCL